MNDLNMYPISLMYMKDGEGGGYHAAVLLLAVNADEALGKALKLAASRWPDEKMSIAVGTPLEMYGIGDITPAVGTDRTRDEQDHQR